MVINIAEPSTNKPFPEDSTGLLEITPSLYTERACLILARLAALTCTLIDALLTVRC